MNTYVILIRGINVGGRNKVSMAELKSCLVELGFSDVQTYIASGNVILRSPKSAPNVTAEIERALPQNFELDDELVRVLVLSVEYLKSVVDDKPAGFGDEPDKYHSDAIFLMGIDSQEAMQVFRPKDGVDTVWPGSGVIYSARLSAQRTKSNLSRIVGTRAYKSMTIHTWNTTLKLLELAIKIN